MRFFVFMQFSIDREICFIPTLQTGYLSFVSELVACTIQQIVLEHRRRYGYRRVTAELRRRGLLRNQKGVARPMREDNLLAVQPRVFAATTDGGV